MIKIQTIKYKLINKQKTNKPTNKQIIKPRNNPTYKTNEQTKKKIYKKPIKQKGNQQTNKQANKHKNNQAHKKNKLTNQQTIKLIKPTNNLINKIINLPTKKQTSK